MDRILSNITLTIPDCSYLKNPESSELGRKIVTGSIELIDDFGFEQFNFKKLAQHIQSTEASVYRYFENKHKIILYLTTWYWSWMDYRVALAVVNVDNPNDRLKRCLEVLTDKPVIDTNFNHIDEERLNRIIISESSKSYLTKMVDEENKEGAFSAYKRLVARVSAVIYAVNKDFKYANMMVSTLIEGVHHQRFFAEHLPGLTTSIQGEDAVSDFYTEMVFKMITN
jgi:AcrR family transcriptional regulator